MFLELSIGIFQSVQKQNKSKISIKGGLIVKEQDKQDIEGLYQIFEIINAKGDKGEINEILKRQNSKMCESEKEK